MEKVEYEDGLYQAEGEWRFDYEISGKTVTATLAKCDACNLQSARLLLEAWRILIQDIYGMHGEPYDPESVQNSIDRVLAARKAGQVIMPIFKRSDGGDGYMQFDVYQEEPVFPEMADLVEMAENGMCPILDIHSIELPKKKMLSNVMLEEYAYDLCEWAMDAGGYAARCNAQKARAEKSMRQLVAIANVLKAAKALKESVDTLES